SAPKTTLAWTPARSIAFIPRKIVRNLPRKRCSTLIPSNALIAAPAFRCVRYRRFLLWMIFRRSGRATPSATRNISGDSGQLKAQYIWEGHDFSRAESISSFSLGFSPESPASAVYQTLVFDFCFQRLGIRLSDHYDVFACVCLRRVADLLIIAFVELQYQRARRVLIVKINLEPMVLGCAERHNDARPRRQHSQSKSPSQAVLLRVLIRNPVNLGVPDRDDAAIG